MRVALAFLAASMSALVYAQEPQTVQGETFVPITPIERSNPNYPTRAIQHGNEGWVMLSFVVSETGEVEEPMIEDSSGVEAFDGAALEAISKWRYMPTTVNGKPVPQSMVKTRIVFALEGPAKGVTREFQGSYRKIRDLIDAGNYTVAKPLLDEIETEGRHNLYEDALFWALKYGYLEAVQSTDAAEKLRALELALGGRDDSLLPAETFIAAAQRMYVLQVQAVDFSAARATFERLRDSAYAKRSSQHARAVAELTPAYEQIERVIAGPAVLKVKGEIGDHAYWVHDLMRRAFSMTDVNGDLAALDVRCERGTRRYDTFPVDDIWVVPDSWGKCGLYIKGEQGTTFTLVEHPAGTAATPLARE